MQQLLGESLAILDVRHRSHLITVVVTTRGVDKSVGPPTGLSVHHAVTEYGDLLAENR